VIDELKCINCGMCEEACPVDAIEMTSVFDVTGLSRQQMLFDKEKLLSMYDQTVQSGIDPVRTERGVLGPASEILEAPDSPNSEWPERQIGATSTPAPHIRPPAKH
jgi:formate hydrogenlyase subunit 6/NADH:ubiquinone oxidoreductase subunit I